MAEGMVGRGAGFYDAELARPEAPSKAAFWTGWVLGALPALFLLIGSVTAMMHSPQVVEGTTKMGFQPSILPVLGTLEFCCAVLYLIPRTAVLGAVLLTGVLWRRGGLPCAAGTDAVVGGGAVWSRGVGGAVAAAARAAADDLGG